MVVFKGHGKVFDPKKNKIVAQVDEKGYFETDDPGIAELCAKAKNWEIVAGEMPKKQEKKPATRSTKKKE